MNPTLEEIEHANDNLPKTMDNHVASINIYMDKTGAKPKKTYYDFETKYAEMYTITSFTNGKFLVEWGGGCGYEICNSWMEAKSLRDELVSRSSIINRALGSGY